MRQTFPFLLTPLMLLFAFAALAADRTPALPPPTEVQNTPEAQETVQPPNEKSDLQKEFAAPEQGKDVQVRVYKRKSGTIVEEYSVHGRVYMVHVKPAIGTPPYYLYDSNGDGVFERRLPGGYKHISPPTWVIQRF